jgi:hypothetical protein
MFVGNDNVNVFWRAFADVGKRGSLSLASPPGPGRCTLARVRRKKRAATRSNREDAPRAQNPHRAPVALESRPGTRPAPC